MSEEAKKEVMSLEAAVKEIASYLKQCQQIGKENEFAFLMLTYATGGDSDAGTGYYAGSIWDFQLIGHGLENLVTQIKHG